MSGRRRALIVANDRYENEGLRQLNSPAADAEALGRVLGDAGIGGFEVHVVRNEPAHVVSTHIEDLFSEGRPDDVLLLHFSCHGLKNDSGELFFAAANTRPNRLGSTAVPASFVQRCIHASRSRSVVLLLDCCYGGAFGQGVAVRAAGDVNVLDSFPGGRGRAVISASTSMEYAFEGDRLADGTSLPSVFTSALVDGLSTGDADRDEDGWVSLNELYDYVFDRVRERNPGQTPSRDIQMQGEFYLARSRRRRIEKQPLPPDLRAAMTDANMFTRIGAVTELRARLLGDNLAAAVGAHEALREIAATDIRYVADTAQAALQEAQLPIEVEVRGAQPAGVPPPPPAPEPAATPKPEQQPTPVAEPAAPVSSRPVPERGRSENQWLVAVVLVAATAGLVVLNLPGSADSRLAWSDSDTGWYVYRTPFDGIMLTCLVAFAAAVAALISRPGARIAWGVVARSGIATTVTGLIILVGGIASDQRGAWVWTTLAGAGIAGVALFAARLDLRFDTRLNRSAVALIVAGGVLRLAAPSITYSGESFLAITNGTVILDILVNVTAAWLAIAVADRPTQLIIGIAEAVAVVIAVIGNAGVWTVGQHANFLLQVGGGILLLVGLAVGLTRRSGSTPATLA